MSLITEVSDRRQNGIDKLRAKSDGSKHRVGWAVVEGSNVPPGWFGLNEYTSGIVRGIPGNQRLLHFDEFKDQNGKTNDIHYKGMTLREMVADEAHCRELDRWEGQLSEQNVQEFQRGRQDHGEGRSYTSTVKEDYVGGQFHDEHPPETAAPRPKVQGFSIPPAPKPGSWSPARRAAQAATLAAKQAAKSQSTTT